MALDIESAYALSREQIDSFRTNGFIKLKNVLSPETIDRYGSEITRLTIDRCPQTEALAERNTYGKAFLQAMNLWELSDRVRELVMSRRLGRIAAEILEVDGVRLFHDQSLYKEPGGGITPAHADQYYWPLATDRTVTAWIPLQAVPQEMGPLAFFAGSQGVEFGRELSISDESEREISRNMRAHGFPMVDEPFEVGEVSFHLGWVFHRAGANVSNRPRSVMTIIYMDQNMRLVNPKHNYQRENWEMWCPGSTIGQIIATSKNPLIYSA